MANLPQVTQASETGDRAVTHVQAIFEGHGWKFRRQDGSTDFGIDAEVEKVENRYITGKLIKLQIKGTGQELPSAREDFPIRVQASTWELWNRMSLPTFAVLADVRTPAVYWCQPIAFPPRENASTTSLHFSTRSRLDKSFDEFNRVVEATLRNYPDPSIVLEVPGFFKMAHEKLLPNRDWSDHLTPIEPEDDFLGRLFYKHVLRLRISVGLNVHHIHPVENFYLRSRTLGDWTKGCLFREVFSEMLDYIMPQHNQALYELKRRSVDVPVTFENEEVINFLRAHEVFGTHKEELLGSECGITLRIRDPRDDPDSKFQADFQSALESCVRLRFRLSTSRRFDSGG